MHQLIQLDPLARVTVAIGGFAPTRPIPRETPWTAPEGYAYVPVIDRPDYDPETQHCERTLTAEEDGWTVRDLNEEELAARIPAPSETVEVGGLTLRAEQEDRQRFVELLTLLREAEGLGMLPATTLISDAAGVAHDLPTATVRQLLVGYGAALQARWNADKLSEQP